MDRMLLIRARQLALKQGYAVHLTCSSETHLARDSNHWSCCKCGRVPSDEVVSRSSALEEVVADSAYLLAELDKRELTVHCSVPLVLPTEALKPVDGQFGTTHAIARFLLAGPDVHATLDYAQGLHVVAQWKESTEERWNQLLAAEPDPNPPEED